MGPLAAWAAAFALTQAIEVPIYLRAQRSLTSRAWLIAFGASTVTHPIVWFALPMSSLQYELFVVAAELFAVAAEAAWLRAFRVERALPWSVAANGASFGVGLLLSWLTGWP